MQKIPLAVGGNKCISVQLKKELKSLVNFEIEEFGYMYYID